MNKEKIRLLEIINNFSNKKIAVWGDFILDEYIYGYTHRISREAPVLILSFKKKEFSLGGAGNSLLNLKALGAIPFPIGVIGPNEPGKKIIQILKKKEIITNHLIIEKSCQTPVKTRILAGDKATRSQQILRIDQEIDIPDNKTLNNKVQGSLLSVKDDISAIIISDYNYLSVKESTFYTILPVFLDKNIPVTLDSRFRLLNFKGVTIATPNESEVEESLKIKINDNIETLNKAGRLILKKTRSPALLVTRGSNGMVLFEKRKTPYSVPIYGTTDIVDVTGAGDTVISVITLALACGASFKEAALLANYAGGIVVMKKGPATVTPKELKMAVISEN